ncbi:metK [Symbiodinium microadriaticum]|nr:metK [Symbiodinium microadriaticum]
MAKNGIFLGLSPVIHLPPRFLLRPDQKDRHPDKVCDRISDEIVDLFFSREPQSRVAVETLTTTNRIVLAGEVRGPEDNPVTAEEMEEAARQAVKDIGYEQDGFHWKNAEVSVHVHAQSAHIAQGVDAAGNKDEGAGDQGIMFGYACRETDVLMPAPIFFSHEILKAMAKDRHAGVRAEFGPDSKSQVTLEYKDGKPVRATSVVVSTQHAEGLDQAQIKELVRPYVEQVLPDGWMCPEDEFYVNPTGQFVIGGPDGDAGLRPVLIDKPTPPHTAPHRHLYGRRKGKKLRDYQADLMASLYPRLAINVAEPLNIDDLFGRSGATTRLEIGFGGAEHLLHEASANPAINYLGCEPFENGMAKALAGIDRAELSNLRLFMGDAREVLDALPDGSLDRVDILYPDPWPKKRHWKRRFISRDNLDAIARVLKSGHILRFASDINSYLDWTLDHIRQHPDFSWTATCADDWRTPWDGWPGTRYEKKALREGRKGHYLSFLRM